MPVTKAPTRTIHILQQDWVGNSGETWTDIVIFKAVKDPGLEPVVFVSSITADSNGKVLFDHPDKSYRIDNGRRHYKWCLDDGYRPVDRLPVLIY